MSVPGWMKIISGIYFCEFDDFEAVEAVGFSIGLVMIVAGVYVLSSGKAAVQRSGLLELGPADIQREQTLSSELGHTPRSSIMSLLAPVLTARDVYVDMTVLTRGRRI